METQNRASLSIERVDPSDFFMGIQIASHSGALGFHPEYLIKSVGQAVAVDTFVNTKVIVLGSPSSEPGGLPSNWPLSRVRPIGFRHTPTASRAGSYMSSSRPTLSAMMCRLTKTLRQQADIRAVRVRRQLC